jgi:hypothetical protein
MTIIYDPMGNVISSDGDLTDVQDMGGQSVYGDTNFLSVDYYRNKVVEFQKTLNLMDETYSALYNVMEVVMQDDVAYDEWFSLLSQLNDKRTQFKTVAEAINLASSGLNAVGVAFPKVELPAGLAVAPAVALGAAAAAVAAAVALIMWAQQFWGTVRDALQRWQYLDIIKQLPADQRAAAINKLKEAETKVELAKTDAEKSSLNNIANIGKWIVIVSGLYFGYKLFINKYSRS